MLINDLKNKKILIWGLGSEGRAVKEYLEKHKVSSKIYAYNDDDGTEKLNKLIKNEVEVIIRSPGVSIYKPEFLEIKNKGIKITSSSDLFLSEMRTNHPQTKVIGISGSKGKSTSVSMLYHMMRELGATVALGGNIGRPLIELIDGNFDYIVGEFSSYQASDLSTSPHVVMFTNLFSVHTDWHKGHDNYCRDKIHLAANQQAGEICVINGNNAQLKDYCKNLKNVSYYGLPEAFHARGKELFYNNEIVLNINDLHISGNHNMDNLAGVVTVMDKLGLDWRKGLQTLKTFEPLPHRLQKVATINDVLFINDSISTAPEAAIGAMQSFDEPIAIISGGIENHQDYTQYANFVANNSKVKAVITLFQCGPQIAEAVRKVVKRDDFKLIEADDLETAVKSAYDELQHFGGGLVLFSPTAPSFGYYKNFIERGEHFIDIVKKFGNNS